MLFFPWKPSAFPNAGANSITCNCPATGYVGAPLQACFGELGRLKIAKKRCALNSCALMQQVNPQDPLSVELMNAKYLQRQQDSMLGPMNRHFGRRNG